MSFSIEKGKRDIFGNLPECGIALIEDSMIGDDNCDGGSNIIKEINSSLFGICNYHLEWLISILQDQKLYKNELKEFEEMLINDCDMYHTDVEELFDFLEIYKN